MEKIFEDKICSVCKKQNTQECKYKIKKEILKDIIRIYCDDYGKDKEKIKPYVGFAYVTTKRKSTFET